MSKWTKTRRDPGRTYQSENEAAQLREDMKRVRELVEAAAEGSLDAEPNYLKILNRLEPEMSVQRRQELLMQFRDAVLEQPRHAVNQIVDIFTSLT